ncbi:MAG: hypothetical protein L0Y39_02680 [Methylococcaceae bacterium]|nr:hypothetical protein [Methylococcaceae bacterium]
MPVQHCKPTEIVSTKYCTVWQCPDCRTIRLQLGDLTLELTPQQLQGIARGLNQTVQRMEALQADQFGLPGNTSLPK